MAQLFYSPDLADRLPHNTGKISQNLYDGGSLVR